jgi:hypothetical protein
MYTVHFRIGKDGTYERAIWRPSSLRKARQYADEIHDEDTRRDILVKDEDGKICYSRTGDTNG